MSQLKPSSFICFIFIMASSLANAQGSGSHGGDVRRITFEKARHRGVEMVTTYAASYRSGMNPDIVTWIYAHRAEIAHDIFTSPHEWVDEVLSHDAVTVSEKSAPIKLSRANVLLAKMSINDAASLLIHESIHHLGQNDELFADGVAVEIARSYEQRLRLEQGQGYAIDAELPLNLQSRQEATKAFVGTKLFIWGGASLSTGERRLHQDGYVFDPVTRAWSPLPLNGAPSPRAGARAFSYQNKLLLIGGRGNQGPLNDGAVFDLDTMAWQKIPEPPALLVPSMRAVSHSERVFFWENDPSSNDGRQARLPMIFNFTTRQWSPWEVAIPYLSGVGPYVAIGEDTKSPDDDAIIVCCSSDESWGGAVGTHINLATGSVDPIMGPLDPAFWHPSVHPFATFASTSIKLAWTGRSVAVLAQRRGSPFETQANGHGARLAFYEPSTKKWSLAPIGRGIQQGTNGFGPNPQLFANGDDLYIATRDPSLVPVYRYSIHTNAWVPMTLNGWDGVLGADADFVWTGESIIGLSLARDLKPGKRIVLFELK